MSISLEGRSVLLTGASSGIGAALAGLLAPRVAHLGLTGRDGSRLHLIAEGCRAAGTHVETWQVDFDDPAAAVTVATGAFDDLDGVDVLINNAGAPMRRHVSRVSADELESTMRINFESPVAMTMALLPHWLERGWGMVVNVSSLGGRLGILHEAAYCASKFALAGWSESMALDLWNTGVEVRLIIPGPIDTGIWDRPGSDPAVYDGPKEPPETVAHGIIAAIEGDGFEHYLPDLKGIVEFKTSDIDAFLEGSAAQLSTNPDA